MPLGASAFGSYRRRPMDPHAFFSEAEIARAGAYRGPLRRAGRAESTLLAGALLVALSAHAGLHLLAAFGLSGWAWQALAVSSVMVLAVGVLDLPFGRWRLAYERRWGFARQSTIGWARDRALELVISLVLLDGVSLGFVALARATPLWWLLTWLGVSVLSVLMAMVAPAVLSPLFNRFRPLEDPDLVAATVALGAQVGVAIRQVLVMDASRRTAKHNAYFTGLGRTKRVVLWDTLLADYGRAATLAVLAHELGHWRRHHLPTLLAMTSAVSCRPPGCRWRRGCPGDGNARRTGTPWTSPGTRPPSWPCNGTWPCAI
jgi:STE24 endopeptidase